MNNFLSSTTTSKLQVIFKKPHIFELWEKDLKTEGVIAVMYATLAAVKIKPEKKKNLLKLKPGFLNLKSSIFFQALFLQLLKLQSHITVMVYRVFILYSYTTAKEKR